MANERSESRRSESSSLLTNFPHRPKSRTRSPQPVPQWNERKIRQPPPLRRPLQNPFRTAREFPIFPRIPDRRPCPRFRFRPDPPPNPPRHPFLPPFRRRPTREPSRKLSRSWIRMPTVGSTTRKSGIPKRSSERRIPWSSSCTRKPEAFTSNGFRVREAIFLRRSRWGQRFGSRFPEPRSRKPRSASIRLRLRNSASRRFRRCLP